MKETLLGPKFLFYEMLVRFLVFTASGHFQNCMQVSAVSQTSYYHSFSIIRRHFDFLNCAILHHHLCGVRCGHSSVAVEVDVARLEHSQDSWLLAKLLPSETSVFINGNYNIFFDTR